MTAELPIFVITRDN